MSNPNTIEFVFIAPPEASPASFEPVQNIADQLSPGVQIKNVKEMVARVLKNLSGRKISRMSFVGHGGKGYFYIGVETISHRTIMEHAGEFIKLAPHFAPDATVTIYSCETAFNATGMYLLSILWPGVSVKGYTGLVEGVEDPLFGNGIKTDGGTVTCSMLGCNSESQLQRGARILLTPPMARFF